MPDLEPKKNAAIHWKARQNVEAWRTAKNATGMGYIGDEEAEQLFQKECERLAASGKLKALVEEHATYLRSEYQQRSGRTPI